jgi:nucleoside-diphosphate-sugar epimerase
VCDLAEAHAFQTIQALESIDYVVHLAAFSDVHFSLIRPDLYVRDNVLATSNLIQAVARHSKIKRFVLVSSCEVYGNTLEPATEAHGFGPRTPYAASKLAQEFMALSSIDHQQLPVVICRLFNNYGQGQQGSRLIPRITSAMRRDGVFTLVGDGSQTRDWVAVEDTCDALIRVLFEPKVAVGDVFNISTHEVLSVLQVLEMCEQLSDRPLLIRRSAKDNGHLEASAGNAEKLRSMTGWAPRRTLRSHLSNLINQTLVGEPH